MNKNILKAWLKQFEFWFGVGFGLAIILGWLVWYVWERYGDQRIIASASLQIAALLFGLNLLLSLVAYDRERFASYLLLGATITIEILTIVFLYLV